MSKLVARLTLLVLVVFALFAVGCDMQNAEAVCKFSVGRIHPENGNFYMEDEKGAKVQTRNLEGDQVTPVVHASSVTTSSSGRPARD